jgi:hypothetical protein
MSRLRFGTDRGRFRQGWRGVVVSWLCLALVGFNLLAGAGLPIAAEPRGDESIVVCSAGGMTVVDLGAASGSSSPSHGQLCAFCLPLLHGSVGDTVTSAVVLMPSGSLAPVILPRQSIRLVRFEQGGAAGPRAPPMT